MFSSFSVYAIDLNFEDDDDPLSLTNLMSNNGKGVTFNPGHNNGNGKGHGKGHGNGHVPLPASFLLFITAIGFLVMKRKDNKS